jgi:hypothetical protein
MREYPGLMPWHVNDLTPDELLEIIKDQDARHKTLRDEARKARRRG